MEIKREKKEIREKVKKLGIASKNFNDRMQRARQIQLALLKVHEERRSREAIEKAKKELSDKN